MQITIRDTKDCFYLYEVPPPRVRKHLIRPRISRSWFEHVDDENWDVVDFDDMESWVSQDLLKTCASVEPVSEQDYCQIGMTAIILGDVNAVYTLECAYRRQLLAARALIRGVAFPRTKTVGDVYVDDLGHSQCFVIFRRACRFVAHQCAACRCCVPNVGKSDSTLSGEFWGGHFDGVAGTLGFPLERRVSLTLITMLIAAVGENRTLLQRLLGGWAFASLSGEKCSPASMCPTLEPRLCLQADDVK